MCIHTFIVYVSMYDHHACGSASASGRSHYVCTRVCVSIELNIRVNKSTMMSDLGWIPIDEIRIYFAILDGSTHNMWFNWRAWLHYTLWMRSLRGLRHYRLFNCVAVRFDQSVFCKIRECVTNSYAYMYTFIINRPSIFERNNNAVAQP